MIKGLKLGHGAKRDKDRPYKGNKLGHGRMSVGDCLSAGFIPLTVDCTGNGYIDLKNKLSEYVVLHVESSVGGVKEVNIVIFPDTGESSTNTNMARWSCYYDLEPLYAYDLSALSTITKISSTGYPGFTPMIVKWLEPISSGGG